MTTGRRGKSCPKGCGDTLRLQGKIRKCDTCGTIAFDDDVKHSGARGTACYNCGAATFHKVLTDPEIRRCSNCNAMAIMELSKLKD